ncbi:CarD family transcriptional regulator [Georgenia sp. AZ-5]|uniref:CarD family transcriptional regulator n=1 Tax=Georgenia sp. AZ-5 TaxID=3367526 RepID=UPI00375409F6
MKFSQGQIVVHPHHGPSTVTEISTRFVRNVPARYLRLQVHHSKLEIGVPVANAEDLGVRPLLDVDRLRDLFDVLCAPTGHEEQGWSRRFKDNHEKLRAGDVLVTAGVVRDLTRRRQAHGLSMGEKDLLKDAQRPLVAELALALAVAAEEAERILEAAIVDGERPSLDCELAAAG